MSARPTPSPKSLSKGVAYIIVSWNNKGILEDCIKSIHRQTDTTLKRIILVDNSSSDGTLDFVSTNFPDVEILPQPKNYGFARGNNIGINKALEDNSIEYLVLLNTDARLDTNWTHVLTEAAKLHPHAATMQSLTLDYYDPGTIDSTHIYISKFGQGTQGSWRQPLPYGNDVAPQKVFGCNAAAMLVTRGFVEAQPFKDFFDETMFMYLEDVDVGARATVMGWDNFVVPGTRAHHMGSVSSSKKDPRFSLYMTFRNNTGLLIKNLPAKTLWPIFFRMLKADRAAIKHLKRTGRSQAIPSVVKGRLASILYIPIFLWKRHKLSKYRIIDPDYLWHLMRRGY